MLESFTVRNFRSIKEATLSLTFAERRAPAGFRTMENIPFVQVGKTPRDRLVTAMALYGPNGCGKSALIRAAHTLRDTVLDGWYADRYDPNLLVSELWGKPSEFSMTFWQDGIRSTYALSIDAEGIVAESLTADGRLVFAVENAELTAFNEKLPDNPTLEEVEELFRTEAVHDRTKRQVLTFIDALYYKLDRRSRISAAVDFFLEELAVVEKEDLSDFLPGLKALAFSVDDPDAFARFRGAGDMVRRRLRQLDIDLQDFEYGPEIFETVPTEGLDGLTTVQAGDDKAPVRWFWQEESDGTKRLIGLLGFLLSALEEGKTVLVDDLDASTHGLLVIELVRLFKERRLNKTNAQIIFTLHNTHLLDAGLLRVSEIATMRLIDCRGTEIQRLSAVPGMEKGPNPCRNGEIRRRYLRGDFGGIPSAFL